MNGPFTVVFQTALGLVERVIVFANNSEEAVKVFLYQYEYPCDILDVYLDHDLYFYYVTRGVLPDGYSV